MAITYDTSFPGTFSSLPLSAPSATISYTNSGNLLVVCVHVSCPNISTQLQDSSVTCTFGGIPETGHISDRENKTGPSTTSHGSFLFYWLNPPTGTYNIVATVSNSGGVYSNGIFVAAESFIDVGNFYEIYTKSDYDPLNPLCKVNTPGGIGWVMINAGWYGVGGHPAEVSCNTNFVKTGVPFIMEGHMQYLIGTNPIATVNGYEQYLTQEMWWCGISFYGTSTQIKAVHQVLRGNIKTLDGIANSSVKKVNDLT